MKKTLLSATLLLMGATALADINITFQSQPLMPVTLVQNNIVPDEEGSHNIEKTLVTDADNHVSYKVEGTEPVIVLISIDGKVKASVLTAPDENITVNIPDSGDAVVTGTPLMDDIAEFESGLKPYVNLLNDIRNRVNTTDNFDDVYAQYAEYVSNFVKTHPQSPAAPYALLHANDDNFTTLFPTLSDNARRSIVYPLAELQKESVEQRMASQRFMEELESGKMPAPGFTLRDLNGKNVSLSDFRGKWVVLDFWASWCGWCIKGFPKLKEAYHTYAGLLEVIGIDCDDHYDEWQAAVKKYSLPWVNLYNDMSTNAAKQLLQEYGVGGFPTKVIISPDGIIKKVVVGEDPAFYDYLRDFIK